MERHAHNWLIAVQQMSEGTHPASSSVPQVEGLSPEVANYNSVFWTRGAVYPTSTFAGGDQPIVAISFHHYADVPDVRVV
jgi:hypothetical protein